LEIRPLFEMDDLGEEMNPSFASSKTGFVPSSKASRRGRGRHQMAYIDGFVRAVPTANREK
jgi:hypothetical protein